MNLWAALHDIGMRQHGVITRGQALALGIPAATFDRRMRSERWRRIHPGVRLLPGADATSHLALVTAAVLAVGDHALATGWSGLYAHGVILRPPPIVTLVVPWNRGTRRLHAVRTIRSRTLLDDDRGTVGGLPVTEAERCMLDTARTDSQARLRTLLIDGHQRRVFEPPNVALRAMLTPGVPGAHRLIAAVRDVDQVGADSVFSDAVHRRLLDAGLEPDPQPVGVPTPGGRVLHPDITFGAAKVCIECDSLGFHGTQRGLDLDHRKDLAYLRAGWIVIRVGWLRYETDWDGFVRDVRAALRLASRAG
jgi:hypothetical protein